MTHPYQHHSVIADGVALHYASVGDGEPVLLIGGWPQTWYQWRHVVPLLNQYGRRTIMLDLRGIGGSDKPIGGYDLDTVAADVHQVIEELGIAGTNGVDVVSHDVGSWVSYALASAYPADVRRLVLSEMTFQTSDAVRPVPDEAANIAGWHFAFNRLPDLPEALVSGRERIFLDWLFDHKSLRPETIDEAARIHYAEAFAAPGAARAGFDYYRALLTDSSLARATERLAHSLPMPVLAIGAEGGVRSRLGDSLRTAAADLHTSVLDGGHYLPEENPTGFVERIVAFWEAK